MSKKLITLILVIVISALSFSVYAKDFAESGNNLSDVGVLSVEDFLEISSRINVELEDDQNFFESVSHLSLQEWESLIIIDIEEITSRSRAAFAEITLISVDRYAYEVDGAIVEVFERVYVLSDTTQEEYRSLLRATNSQLRTVRRDFTIRDSGHNRIVGEFRIDMDYIAILWNGVVDRIRSDRLWFTGPFTSAQQFDVGMPWFEQPNDRQLTAGINYSWISSLTNQRVNITDRSFVRRY